MAVGSGTGSGGLSQRTAAAASGWAPRSLPPPAAAARGRRPRLTSAADVSGECRRQVAAPPDAELAVAAAEVRLDGLQGHPELLGDLAVRTPVGGQAGHALLARGERVAARDPVAAGPCGGRRELPARGNRPLGGAAPRPEGHA